MNQEKMMEVRMTAAQDWPLLKQVRLAALSSAPTAFGVSYGSAVKYTDEQWQERASAAAGPEFWLAFADNKPVGMIGGGVSQSGRYNLIGMWVEPEMRGSGIASSLVEAVKSRALQTGHGRIFWTSLQTTRGPLPSISSTASLSSTSSNHWQAIRISRFKQWWAA